MQALFSTLVPKEINDCITVGSRVTVRFPNGPTRVFTITDQTKEVAPDKGVISDQSPLGAALLGKTVGDHARFAVGVQTSSVEIVEVEPAGKE